MLGYGVGWQAGEPVWSDRRLLVLARVGVKVPAGVVHRVRQIVAGNVAVGRQRVGWGVAGF